MRYLSKSDHSIIIKEGWQYVTQSHRPQIREALLNEQQQFCAYTERYIGSIDAPEIEHFDDRLKGTPEDSYWNWYVVHRWVNQKKQKIENFLPILQPHDPDVPRRIIYKNGQFQAVNDDDVAAKHLIDLLCWNDPGLAQYREKRLSRLQDTRRRFFLNDDHGFLDYLLGNPDNLSFITILEVELGLSIPSPG